MYSYRQAATIFFSLFLPGGANLAIKRLAQMWLNNKIHVLSYEFRIFSWFATTYDMIFDVCNLCDKIGVSLLPFRTTTFKQFFCKSWLPKPKSDCPGQSSNLIVAACVEIRNVQTIVLCECNKVVSLLFWRRCHVVFKFLLCFIVHSKVLLCFIVHRCLISFLKYNNTLTLDLE